MRSIKSKLIHFATENTKLVSFFLKIIYLILFYLNLIYSKNNRHNYTQLNTMNIKNSFE